MHVFIHQVYTCKTFRFMLMDMTFRIFIRNQGYLQKNGPDITNVKNI